MKILIIQTAFIGDAILATSLIENLKLEYADSSIDFLVRKGNESLFKNHPKLNNVLIFDKKDKYKNLLPLIKGIRKEKYDYVINLQRFLTTGLITCLSGAKIKIGFDKNPLSMFFTKSYKHEIDTGSNIHEIERNHLLIESLTKEKVQRIKLYPSKKDQQVVPQNQEYVCIAPASNWFTKQFPFEKWCELIPKIPNKYQIYLIGGKPDLKLCERIKNTTKDDRVNILAGELSFLESAALIEHAAMTYTNDSSPLHIASSVNAPVTAVFCSTVPAFGFGPLSDNSTLVETDENLSCRPCGLHGKKECPENHFKCADIKIEKVLKSLK